MQSFSWRLSAGENIFMRYSPYIVQQTDRAVIITLRYNYLVLRFLPPLLEIGQSCAMCSGVSCRPCPTTEVGSRGIAMFPVIDCLF